MTGELGDYNVKSIRVLNIKNHGSISIIVNMVSGNGRLATQI